jgi:putative Ca2+/H+ antiporter (TMEM165/GDT1 family)
VGGGDGGRRPRAGSRVAALTHNAPAVRTLLTTFGVIFLAELPDKTALATVVLATRYRAISVVLGAWAAFLVQTVVAVAAGGLLTLLPERPIRVAAGAGFLVFAVLAWRRDPKAEEREEKAELDRRGVPRSAILSSFLVVFAAEWGDLTQLATAALVAQTGEVIAVGVGALAALCLVTVIAVAAGNVMTRFIAARTLEVISGFVFAMVGVLVIVSALR